MNSSQKKRAGCTKCPNYSDNSRNPLSNSKLGHCCKKGVPIHQLKKCPKKEPVIEKEENNNR